MAPDETITDLLEDEQAEETEAAEEITAEEPSVEETPTEETPEEEIPAEEPPVEEDPVEEDPVEETPAVPALQKNEKKTRRPAVRVLCGVLSVILVILMIVPALLGLTVANLKNITSQNVISQILSGILTSAPAVTPFPVLSAPLAAGTLPDGLDAGDVDIGGLTGEGSTDFVVDYVYGMLKDQYGDQVNVTKEQMSDFLEESTAKEFVVEKVSGLVSDMINGTNTTTITMDEINTLVDENAALIKEHFDIVITQEQKDTVTQVVQKSHVLETIEEDGLLGVIEQMSSAGTDAPDTGLESQDPSQSAGSAGNDMAQTIASIKQALEMFRQAASTQNLLICIGVFLVMSLLLFFLNNRGIPGTLVGMGIPIALAGSIYAIPSIAAVNSADLIIETLAQSAEGGALIGKAVVTALSVIMPLNVTVMCVGFAMIIAAIVVKIVLTQKAKKTA